MGARGAESFFERPILNSPYAYPGRHWELDEEGQPTNHIIEIAPPIGADHAGAEAEEAASREADRRIGSRRRRWVLDRRAGIQPDPDHQRDPAVCRRVAHLPNPNQWQVTPETARLLQHWRHHRVQRVPPFFCQVEAVETAIWLTEVAPTARQPARKFWTHLAAPTRRPTPSCSASR